MTEDASARILVVDDDPGLRTLLQACLGDSGFAVETAADGRAMDAALARGMPDAIVLDLMLPGADGLSLARRLRSASNVPILMISARGEEVDRVVGLEMGADDYGRDPYGRSVDTRVTRLRRKIEPDPVEPVYIRTVRGEGYLFNPRGGDA